MPRTSRKVTVGAANNCSKPVELERIFRTAIYARLSNEDSGRADGQTLENQILLAKKYIEAKSYLKLCRTFIDNGRTGTNFDRDGFRELMEAARRGKIDCIVVKDLSRFGRDYIETGDYIEKILPFLGVRFISVNDGYDSHDAAKSGDILAIALKNLVNDIYAKDISRKIKSAFEIKRKKGEFTGGFASYGYLKSPENKHRLVINEETAPIVRDIFSMKLDGMSNTAIARKLNDRGILSPSNYLHSKGMAINERYSKKILWSRDYIRKTLTNPVYIGYTAQGKTVSDLSLGFDRKAQAKDNWVIVENTHEPIIELSVFEAVGNILKQESFERASKPKQIASGINLLRENIFVGIIYCSECGKKLSRRRSANKQGSVYVNFSCPTYDLHLAVNCKNKITPEKKLKQLVLDTIKLQIFLLADKAKKNKSSPKIKNQEQTLRTKMQSAKQRLHQLKSLRSSLYDDFTDNLLAEKEYLYTRKKYEDESVALSLSIGKISEELEKCTADFTVADNYAAQIQRFYAIDELSREVLTALIEKIIVHDKNNIEVVFKYKDEFADLKKYTMA